MVTSVSSSSLTNLCGTSENTGNGSIDSNEFSNKYEEILGKTKEEFFSNCSVQRVNTLESFINSHSGNHSSRYSLTEDDYRAEFKEYMTSRGCSDENELATLNSTKFLTKHQLIDYAGGIAEYASATLYGNGFTSEGFIGYNDISSLVSNASLQDMADYVNEFDIDQSPARNISSFKSFIDKVAVTSGVDEALKTKLIQMSKEISNSSDAIAEFCDKIDKEAAAQRALNSDFEKQKYSVA